MGPWAEAFRKDGRETRPLHHPPLPLGLAGT